MINVAVLFLRGGTASTALLPFEIFRSAGVFWNLFNNQRPRRLFRVTTATINGKPIRVDDQVKLTPHTSVCKLAKPDIVFVQAGGLDFETIAAGRYNLHDHVAQNADLIPWLQRWASEGVNVASACGGVALLAAAGLLDGKRATGHWGFHARYQDMYPAVDWQMQYLVTESGNIFCGGGGNSASDLALYMVEKFCGREIALQCAKALLIEMPRIWQVGFTHFPICADHGDAIVLRVQDWLHKHYAEDVNVEDIAAKFGMSSRTFQRRFKQATAQTPLGYVHNLRVTVARRQIENGRQSIHEVMSQVGYDDPLFFRRLFKRHTGLTPADYRRRFGPSRFTVAAE